MFETMKFNRQVRRLERWSTDTQIRVNAASTLGESGNPRAVEPLIEALGDDEEFGRCAVAAEALGRLGDRRALEPLKEAFGDRESVRCAAAAALEKPGEPMWQRIVLTIQSINRMEKYDQKSWAQAGRDFGQVDDARAIGPLIETLSQHEHRVRYHAATFLAGLASVCPSAIGKRWDEVSALARKPHNDEIDVNEGRCAVSTHGDEGIGVDFPDPPPGLDF